MVSEWVSERTAEFTSDLELGAHGLLNPTDDRNRCYAFFRGSWTVRNLVVEKKTASHARFVEEKKSGEGEVFVWRRRWHCVMGFFCQRPTIRGVSFLIEMSHIFYLSQNCWNWIHQQSSFYLCYREKNPNDVNAKTIQSYNTPINRRSQSISYEVL